MSRITAVIKAKNEAAQIQDAIASARLLASDVLVVDDHSTDATASLAAEAGAEVVRGEPHHGSIDLLDKQGFALVRSGWILRMDADERLTPTLARHLRWVTDDPSDLSGAKYARRYWMFGAPISSGGWLRPVQLGLFRADRWDSDWTAALHSQVPVAGRIATVDPRGGAWMEHYDYANVAEFATRSLMKYAAADAAQRYSRGERFRARTMIWSPFRKVVGRLVLRHGYRDGARGCVLAALLAAYDISVYAHLWDLERRHAPGSTPR
ncbi:glycosyltransferase family 2 protein [Streptomyces sp. NPDC005146]